MSGDAWRQDFRDLNLTPNALELRHEHSCTYRICRGLRGLGGHWRVVSAGKLVCGAEKTDIDAAKLGVSGRLDDALRADGLGGVSGG